MLPLQTLFKKYRSRKAAKLLRKAKSAFDASDYPIAFRLFLKAVALNSTEAKYWLGMCYLRGKGVAVNIHDALSWHECAANEGWLASCYILALLYVNGIPEYKQDENVFFQVKSVDYSNIKPDLERAFVWAEKAAFAHLAEGQALYAYLLSLDPERKGECLKWYDRSIDQDSPQGYMGKGLFLLKNAQTEEDYCQAASLLELASQRGMTSAMYRLGVMYETGKGLEKNFERAAELYKQAAEAGIREAQALYGVALKKGQGVERNFIQAETWLRKAALKGDIEAAVILGDMNGQGNEEIPPNYIEALRWYTHAANNGHITATRALALLYLNGLGVTKSIEKAVEFLKKSSLAGDVESASILADIMLKSSDQSMINEALSTCLSKISVHQPEIAYKTAIIHLKNYNLTQKEEEAAQARHWLHHSQDQVVPAKLWLGKMKLGGIGGDKDIEGAYRLISSAAEDRMPEAQCLWASILLQSQSSDMGKIAMEALKLYKSAAEQDNVSAMFSVAALYGGGNYLAPDRFKAQQWFERAANKGHSQAQLMLGRYYAKGLAGSVDLKQARFWFEKALQNGLKEAQKELETLELESLDEEAKNKKPTKTEISPGLHIYNS